MARTVTVHVRDFTGADSDVPEAEREILRAVTLTMAAVTQQMPGRLTLNILCSIILTLTGQFEDQVSVWDDVTDEVDRALDTKRRQEN